MFRRSLFMLIATASLLLAQDVRELINQGVTAFKSGNYSEAVQEFQKAADQDPSSLTARLYLATAYMQQYVPGAASPDNMAFAESALREFNKVLNIDPSNRVAMASIASLYLNQKQFDQAQQWYEKLTAVDPQNADAYYSMGFIAWSKFYPAYADARKQLGMRPQDPGPLPAGSVKEGLKAGYSQTIEQGLQALEKALVVNPKYDDAMAYMNLLIRERADLLDNQDAYRSEIAVADDWVQKALAAKRQKQEAIAGGGGGDRMTQKQEVIAGGGGGDRMPPQRIQIAEAVQSQQLVNKVPPAAATVSGQVVLNVIVGRDGHVQDIRVGSGNPSLVPLALDAVRQWVYKPTLLNGQPVEVSSTVTLTFP